jgi:hypothetical protein
MININILQCKQAPLCLVSLGITPKEAALNVVVSGVLEMRKGHTDQARAFFQTAASLAPAMFEAHYNYSRF